MLVANTAWYLYNFRLPLARFLRDQGYEVVFVSPPDAYVERLEAERFRWVNLGLNRRSLNPLKEVVALWRFFQVYQAEKPRICHHFTIKCVLYGTIAAKLAGVKSVVNAITGLGHAFIGNGRLHRMVRPLLRVLYRKILTARRVQVIFQNTDDYTEFERLGMVKPEKSTIIRGSGVDLKRFQPRPGELEEEPSPTILLASRLTKEKGVEDYVAAARILREQGVRARFSLAGVPDPGNPTSISPETLNSWCQEGCIDYLGHIDRIEDVLHLATVVVLPSYREGTPKILLEAAAMGKPLIATDVPGCREVVRHDYNGYLVPVRQPEALARAIGDLVTNAKKTRDFGANSRTMSMEFCESKVIEATEQVYTKARGASRT